MTTTGFSGANVFASWPTIEPSLADPTGACSTFSTTPPDHKTLLLSHSLGGRALFAYLREDEEDKGIQLLQGRYVHYPLASAGKQIKVVALDKESALDFSGEVIFTFES